MPLNRVKDFSSYGGTTATGDPAFDSEFCYLPTPQGLLILDFATLSDYAHTNVRTVSVAVSGTTIYTVEYDSGYKLRAYTRSGSTLTLQATQALSNIALSIAIQGTTVFLVVSNYPATLLAYTFTGAAFVADGTLSGAVAGVDAKNGYVFVSYGSTDVLINSVRVYTHAGGVFSLVTSLNVPCISTISRLKASANGSLIFAGVEQTGVRAITFDGATLTIAHGYDDITWDYSISYLTYDGTYITVTDNWTRSNIFTYDPVDGFTLLDTFLAYASQSSITTNGYFFSVKYLEGPVIYQLVAPFPEKVSVPSYYLSSAAAGATRVSNIRDSYADSNYIYATTASNILEICDATIPSSVNLTQFDTGAPVWSVTKNGNYLYLTGGLKIYDVTNPVVPVLQSTTAINGYLCLHYYSNRVYFLNSVLGGGSIDVYDVSNPLAPSYITTVPQIASSNAQWFFIVGQYLYLTYTVGSYASAQAKATIYDISTPVPSLVKTIDFYGTTFGYYSRPVFYGNYMYLPVDYQGTYVFDVSDPLNIVNVERLATESAVALNIVGTTLLVSCGAFPGRHGKIALYDIANPANPTSIGTVLNTISTWPSKSLLVNNSVVNIIQKYALVYNLSLPPSYDSDLPVSLKSIYTVPDLYSWESYSSLIDGSILYLGSLCLLLVVDISDIAAPTKITMIDLNDYLVSMKKSGNYIFGVLENWELVSIDVSSPSSPSVTHSVYDASFLDLDLDGDYVYAACNSDGLRTYNISDPSAMYNVGSISTGDDFTRVRYRAGKAYCVVDYSDIYVYDVSDPANPSLDTTITPPSYDGFVDIAVDDNYLYAVDYVSQLYIYHLSDLTTIYSQLDIGFYVRYGGITVEGDYAYISMDGMLGLVTVDISDRSQPVIVFHDKSVGGWFDASSRPGVSSGVIVNTTSLYDGLIGIYQNTDYTPPGPGPTPQQPTDISRRGKPEPQFVDRVIRERNLNANRAIFSEVPYLRDQSRPPVVKELVTLDKGVSYFRVVEKGTPPHKAGVTTPTKPILNDTRSVPAPKQKPGRVKKTYTDRRGNSIVVYLK